MHRLLIRAGAGAAVTASHSTPSPLLVEIAAQHAQERRAVELHVGVIRLQIGGEGLEVGPHLAVGRGQGQLLPGLEPADAGQRDQILAVAGLRIAGDAPGAAHPGQARAGLSEPAPVWTMPIIRSPAMASSIMFR